MRKLIKMIEKIPVPFLPTMVGAATLSNVYLSLGFPWIRHLTMWFAALTLLVYIGKIVLYPKTCAKEYGNTVPASLYAGFTMISMILGSYYFDFNPALGKTIWLVAIIIHAIHILVFTFNNVIKSRNINTFLPSWFVTYNGIMVSCVVGGAMQEPGMLTIITYYGIAIYAIIIPIMIWRLIKVKVKDAVIHTQAVVLAPCSLCIVAYLNVIKEPSAVIVYVLYTCVILSLAFIIYKLPKFFSYTFTPGFAGLTFPMAIGIVASTKMAGFLEGAGNEVGAMMIKQISGFQIILTTAMIGFVLFNFFMLFRAVISSKQKVN